MTLCHRFYISIQRKLPLLLCFKIIFILQNANVNVFELTQLEFDISINIDFDFVTFVIFIYNS